MPSTTCLKHDLSIEPLRTPFSFRWTLPLNIKDDKKDKLSRVRVPLSKYFYGFCMCGYIEKNLLRAKQLTLKF
jgi:hypothetical protein